MAELAQIYYDRIGDVLYISLGEPQEAISQEMGEDILLRIHPTTGKVLGLTVLNLSSRFSDLTRPQTLPVRVELEPVTEGL
ncbi:MAG: DUF2283 domain-containing protein [Anaerolineae bacterium]